MTRIVRSAYISTLFEDDKGAPRAPEPADSILLLNSAVVITPTTMDAAQKAKNTDAITALCVSIKSGAEPAQSDESITELAA